MSCDNTSTTNSQGGIYAHLDDMCQEGLRLRINGKHRESKKKYRQCLEAFRNALDNRSINAVCRESAILDELGNSAFLAGDYKEAERSYKEAISLFDQTHPAMAGPLDHLARLYIARGDFEKARPLCYRSLALKENSLLPNNCETLETMRMCAIVDCELKNYKEAEKLLLKGIAILEPATIGPFEEFVLIMARVKQYQGQIEEAEALYREAISTFSHRWGRPYRSGICMKDYASFLKGQGREDEAEEALQKARRLQKAGMSSRNAIPEQDDLLPNTARYQKIIYPATTFH